MTRNPCAHGLSGAFGSWPLPGLLHVAIERPAAIERRAAVVAVRRYQAGARQFVDAPARDADVAAGGLGVQVAARLRPRPGAARRPARRRVAASASTKRSSARRTGTPPGRGRSLCARVPAISSPPPASRPAYRGRRAVRQIGANGPRSARSSSRQIETSTSGVSARSGSWPQSASTVRRRSSSRSLRPAGEDDQHGREDRIEPRPQRDRPASPTRAGIVRRYSRA